MEEVGRGLAFARKPTAQGKMAAKEVRCPIQANFSGNALKALPVEVVHWKLLKQMYLNDLPLGRLPREIGAWKNLKVHTPGPDVPAPGLPLGPPFSPFLIGAWPVCRCST